MILFLNHSWLNLREIILLTHHGVKHLIIVEIRLKIIFLKIVYRQILVIVHVNLLLMHKWADSIHKEIVIILNIIIIVIKDLLVVNKIVVEHRRIYLLIKLHWLIKLFILQIFLHYIFKVKIVMNYSLYIRITS